MEYLFFVFIWIVFGVNVLQGGTARAVTGCIIATNCPIRNSGRKISFPRIYQEKVFSNYLFLF